MTAQDNVNEDAAHQQQHPKRDKEKHHHRSSRDGHRDHHEKSHRHHTSSHSTKSRSSERPILQRKKSRRNAGYRKISKSISSDDAAPSIPKNSHRSSPRHDDHQRAKGEQAKSKSDSRHGMDKKATSTPKSSRDLKKKDDRRRLEKQQKFSVLKERSHQHSGSNNKRSGSPTSLDAERVRKMLQRNQQQSFQLGALDVHPQEQSIEGVRWVRSNDRIRKMIQRNRSNRKLKEDSPSSPSPDVTQRIQNMLQHNRSTQNLLETKEDPAKSSSPDRIQKMLERNKSHGQIYNAIAA